MTERQARWTLWALALLFGVVLLIAAAVEVAHDHAGTGSTALLVGVGLIVMAPRVRPPL